MQFKPTMTQGEIPFLVKNKEGDMVPNPDYPSDLLCHSGHIAPLGSRFFSVDGEVVSAAVQGVYCEFCLMVANRMNAFQKQGSPVPFDPEKELDRLISEFEEGRTDA